VDELVDTVVEAHHSGFNKSLQNYSEILRMFSESRTQLSALRRALESTQIRLHPKSEALREVYRRHLMLGDMVRLLEDVQSVVGVPDTVRQLADRKEWSLAVSTLLSGCNKAARQELSGVGALQQVRRELAAQRHSLVAAMTAELEVRAYDTSSAVSGGARHHASPVKGTVDGHVSTQAPSTVPRRQRPAALISDVNADATDGAQQFTVARPLHRRAATLGGGLPLPTMSPMKPGAGGAGAGHLLDADVSVVTLVNCIAQLGGVPSVLEAVRARMARKVRPLPQNYSRVQTSQPFPLQLLAHICA